MDRPVRIPIFALDRQYRVIGAEIAAAMTRVARAGRFTLGDEVSAFEQEFAAYIGSAHGIGVGSGTDALTLSLRALGLTSNDEVIMPANVYPTAFGVALSGAAIRLVDCDENGLMDLALLPRVVTARTKAVVAVHLYGNPVDMPRLLALLAGMGRPDISVIEDCAQAHGAVIGETPSRRAGTFGAVACFSFYPSKNLGAYGDGGMILTNDDRIASRIKMLRMYGETSRYKSEEISGVSRLDELQAAALRVKLGYLEDWNRRRRALVGRYETALASTASRRNNRGVHGHGGSAIRPLASAGGSCHHLMVIETDRRDELSAYLAARGIQTAVHYPVPVHLTPAFSGLGYGAGDFPITERLSGRILSLPLFPELTDTEVGDVCRQIGEFLQK